MMEVGPQKLRKDQDTTRDTTAARARQIQNPSQDQSSRVSNRENGCSYADSVKKGKSNGQKDSMPKRDRRRLNSASALASESDFGSPSAVSESGTGTRTGTGTGTGWLSVGYRILGFGPQPPSQPQQLLPSQLQPSSPSSSRAPQQSRPNLTTSDQLPTHSSSSSASASASASASVALSLSLSPPRPSIYRDSSLRTIDEGDSPYGSTYGSTVGSLSRKGSGGKGSSTRESTSTIDGSGPLSASMSRRGSGKSTATASVNGAVEDSGGRGGGGIKKTMKKNGDNVAGSGRQRDPGLSLPNVNSKRNRSRLRSGTGKPTDIAADNGSEEGDAEAEAEQDEALEMADEQGSQGHQSLGHHPSFGSAITMGSLIESRKQNRDRDGNNTLSNGDAHSHTTATGTLIPLSDSENDDSSTMLSQRKWEKSRQRGGVDRLHNGPAGRDTATETEDTLEDVDAVMDDVGESEGEEENDYETEVMLTHGHLKRPNRRGSGSIDMDVDFEVLVLHPGHRRSSVSASSCDKHTIRSGITSEEDELERESILDALGPGKPWYEGPLFTASWKLAVLFAVFSVVLGGTLWVCVPRLSPEDKPKLKLPRSFSDLQALNTLFQKYRDLYPLQLLSIGIVSYLYVQTFSLPGSMYISILFGAAYGVLYGVIISDLCEATGALMCYTASAICGPPLLEIPAYRKRLEVWSKKILGDEENGERVGWDGVFAFLVILRIAPFPPHWVANVVSPHLGISPLLFWFSAFFGITPISFIHCTIGSGLDSMTSSEDFHLLSVRNVGMLVGVGVAVSIPVALKRVFRKKLGGFEEVGEEESLEEVGVGGGPVIHVHAPETPLLDDEYEVEYYDEEDERYRDDYSDEYEDERCRDEDDRETGARSISRPHFYPRSGSVARGGGGKYNPAYDYDNIGPSSAGSARGRWSSLQRRASANSSRYTRTYEVEEALSVIRYEDEEVLAVMYPDDGRDDEAIDEDADGQCQYQYQYDGDGYGYGEEEGGEDFGDGDGVVGDGEEHESRRLRRCGAGVLLKNDENEDYDDHVSEDEDLDHDGKHRRDQDLEGYRHQTEEEPERSPWWRQVWIWSSRTGGGRGTGGIRL